MIIRYLDPWAEWFYTGFVGLCWGLLGLFKGLSVPS